MSAGGGWLIRGARPLGAEPADIVIRDGLVAGIGPGSRRNRGSPTVRR